MISGVHTDNMGALVLRTIRPLNYLVVTQNGEKKRARIGGNVYLRACELEGSTIAPTALGRMRRPNRDVLVGMLPKKRHSLTEAKGRVRRPNESVASGSAPATHGVVSNSWAPTQKAKKSPKRHFHEIWLLE
jgi:hypothetical protein